MSALGKIWWRTYFVVALSLTLISIYLESTEPPTANFSDVCDYLFTVVALAGVFGYAFQSRVLSLVFWRRYLPFVVVWDIGIGSYWLYEIYPDYDVADTWLLVSTVGILAAFLLIEYVALFLYGFRSSHLWVLQ